jgi:uncharacterized protein
VVIEEGAKSKIAEEIPPMGKRIQPVNIPPMLTFDENITPGGRRISAIFLVISGFIVGMAAAIMGVGGGFPHLPDVCLRSGRFSMTTVGTDIFQIVFTAGYAAITQYAIYGFIFYTLAMGMLLGSLIGIQVGSIVTKVVPGTTIRGFYAITVTAGFLNRVCALPVRAGRLRSASRPRMRNRPSGPPVFSGSARPALRLTARRSRWPAIWA